MTDFVDKNSRTVEHYTPPWLLEVVERYARAAGFEGIELDPATDRDNWTKAGRFFTAEQDGLKIAWNLGERTGKYGGTFVFVNPPYGRALRAWVEKAHAEAYDGNTVVALLPGQRFEQRYWQEKLMRPEITRMIVPITGRVDFFGRVCGHCEQLESFETHKPVKFPIEGFARDRCSFSWNGERKEGMGNPYGSFLYLLGNAGRGHAIEPARAAFTEIGAPFTIGEAWPFTPVPGSSRANKGRARPVARS